MCYTVIAVTDPAKGARGTSAFIVEKNFPGFKVGKEEDKMGIRASFDQRDHLRRLPCAGEESAGARRRRLHGGDEARWTSRGPAWRRRRWASPRARYELALDYAKHRVQFGHPISSLQAIQFMLADMATAIESARALLYMAAKQYRRGREERRRDVSAMSKLLASDVAMKVTTDAVQIFGGYGYMRDYPIEKFMRDAKITQIYEGTNQIQRMVIARNLMRG